MAGHTQLPSYSCVLLTDLTGIVKNKFLTHCLFLPFSPKSIDFPGLFNASFRRRTDPDLLGLTFSLPTEKDGPLWDVLLFRENRFLRLFGILPRRRLVRPSLLPCALVCSFGSSLHLDLPQFYQSILRGMTPLSRKTVDFWSLCLLFTR